MNFRLLLFSHLDKYFWLGVGLLRLIARYLYAQEGRPLLKTENLRSLTHKNDKGILYQFSIATYFENSWEKNKCVSFSALNSLKINTVDRRPYFLKSL